ncbi:hypothetical protein CR513_02265, partial [Mucuna pruriens]
SKVLKSFLQELVRQVVYGFNLLTPLYLLSLPNISSMTSKDGFDRASFVKNLYENVNAHIEKKIEQYTKQVHLRKGRFDAIPEEI